MRQKKILIVAPHFYPMVGGYANAITNFVKAIEEYAENIEYTLLCNQSLDGHKELNTSKGRIIRLERNEQVRMLFSFLLFEYKLYKKVKELDSKEIYDFILFETFERSVALFLLSKSKLSPKLGFRLHGCTETEFYIWGTAIHHVFRRSLMQRSIKKIAFVFSTNDYHLRFFKKFFLKENQLLAAQTSFYKLENFTYPLEQADNEEFLLQHKLEENRYFFTLGRLDYEGLVQKGFVDIIDAAYLLKKGSAMGLKNYKFVIVGKGAYLTMLTDKIRDLGMSDYFVLIEQLDNKRVHFLQKKSRATVLVSRFEGQSMFALEALSNGSALLFTGENGIEEMVKEEINGKKVPVQDVEKLANALQDFIALEDQRVTSMKEASVALFEEKYAPAMLISKFEKQLELIVSTIRNKK